MNMNCSSGNGWRLMRFSVLLLVILGIAALGLGLMEIWNWLVPDLFGGKTINYPQAMGLLVLSRLLFGHWGGRHCPASRFSRWRLHGMTPEEREKFRAGLRGCCSSKQDEGEYK